MSYLARLHNVGLASQLEPANVKGTVIHKTYNMTIINLVIMIKLVILILLDVFEFKIFKNWLGAGLSTLSQKHAICVFRKNTSSCFPHKAQPLTKDTSYLMHADTEKEAPDKCILIISYVSSNTGYISVESTH